MKKKILMVLFLGLFLFGISKADSQASDVIMVSTPEQLDNIRNNLSGNYQLANDIDMSKYYNFEPIGNENDGAFTGSFDGNGHTIKNLPLDYDTYKYVGLFGYLDGPVYNVTLENVDVKSSRYGGGIAGYADTNGTIRNCAVSGMVTVKNSYFSTYSGGIVGYSNAEITDCENSAYIVGLSSKDHIIEEELLDTLKKILKIVLILETLKETTSVVVAGGLLVKDITMWK